MAKSPTIKFPRIEAGFYGITKDGEFVGYVMREVDDDKETNWYIFDDKEQGKDVAMLHPSNSIDTPDSLLREAKESAKNYFLNKVDMVQAITPLSPLKDEEWVETEPDNDIVEPTVEELEDEDLIEDDNLFVSDDGELEIFEDELEPLNDEMDFDSIEMEDLVPA